LIIIEIEPCTIEISRKDYTHLNQHPINQILRLYNEFLKMTFKNKTPYFDILKIHKVYKDMLSMVTEMTPDKSFLERPAANLTARQMYEDGFQNK